MLDRRIRYLSAVGLTAAALGLVACGSDGSSDRDADRQRTSDTSGMESRESMSPRVITATLMTINEGEIETGRLARDRAQSGEVRRFAEMMVNEHTNANERVRDLSSRQNIQPNEGGVAQQLRRDTQQQMSRLRNLSGAEFDRAYIDSQVQMHQDALQLIDNRMMPSARDTQLRTLVQDMRQHVADHLREAQDIQQNLRADGRRDDRMNR